jgi:hypothetical protein
VFDEASFHHRWESQGKRGGAEHQVYYDPETAYRTRSDDLTSETPPSALRPPPSARRPPSSETPKLRPPKLRPPKLRNSNHPWASATANPSTSARSGST